MQRDLGMATLLLATFATLLFVATRRLDIVVFGAALFVLGAFWAVHHYPYVQTRIAVWQNPFSEPLGAGYQSSQAYYSLASGGLVGTGYRLGHPEFIPDRRNRLRLCRLFRGIRSDWSDHFASDLFGCRSANFCDRAGATGSVHETAGDGTGRYTRISSSDYRSRRYWALTADRNYVAVHVLWWEFARGKFPSRRAGLGDECATAEGTMKPIVAVVNAGGAGGVR